MGRRKAAEAISYLRAARRSLSERAAGTSDTHYFFVAGAFAGCGGFGTYFCGCF